MSSREQCVVKDTTMLNFTSFKMSILYVNLIFTLGAFPQRQNIHSRSFDVDRVKLCLYYSARASLSLSLSHPISFVYMFMFTAASGWTVAQSTVSQFLVYTVVMHSIANTHTHTHTAFLSRSLSLCLSFYLLLYHPNTRHMHTQDRHSCTRLFRHES